MFVLSASPSAFSSAILSSATSARVSFATLASSSKLFAVSVRFTGKRSFACPCFLAMAELVKDKEASSSSATSVSGSGVSVVASGSTSESKEPSYSRAFLNACTEAEILTGIRKEKEAGRLPPTVASGMEELYHNYKDAVLQSGNPKADEIVLSNMAAALDRIFFEVEDPFVFSPYHKALREPFDYYLFGQNYIRPLIDFRNSYVGNISIFSEMEDKLRQGHNIVLMSNHQTEADPAVIALLLEATNPHIAEKITYVAGDRVVTDPLCKPFSMGRNLLCVYSKKHMFDVPELAEMKRKANTRSLKEMALLLRGGSQIVWIAPSGGRDRPDPVTGEWYPAPFDASSVDNMRRLVEHSGAPGHIYPLALLCHDIMPPPLQVEKEIGEKRVISFHGVGVSVAPAISFSKIAVSHESSEENAKEAYKEAFYGSISEQYNVLKSAIHGKQGLKASSSNVSLSQTWT
ncbi:glycerol-3-phosphate acyltransferase ATS12, chloroplastic isoform X2 [Humulus lupulus]|uniref:glycerol-3-phosphate acyltransferase ATS12, chloroplastic isoform X2 n=1 Tax=Humulus lupulus TaxID=3486 RepID=UPI002B40C983|nr:glycerol-3-phosphate acyltransferase ATS12, chloroplastic isoform X2 [Humulus lupulus]